MTELEALDVLYRTATGRHRGDPFVNEARAVLLKLIDESKQLFENRSALVVDACRNCGLIAEVPHQDAPCEFARRGSVYHNWKQLQKNRHMTDQNARDTVREREALLLLAEWSKNRRIVSPAVDCLSAALEELDALRLLVGKGGPGSPEESHFGRFVPANVFSGDTLVIPAWRADELCDELAALRKERAVLVAAMGPLGIPPL